MNYKNKQHWFILAHQGELTLVLLQFCLKENKIMYLCINLKLVCAIIN